MSIWIASLALVFSVVTLFTVILMNSFNCVKCGKRIFEPGRGVCRSCERIMR